MQYDDVLVQEKIVETALTTHEHVDFVRPAIARKRATITTDEFMRKYYGHDMYCPSNENARVFDPVKR